MTPRLHLEIPEESPFFAGHFPGHPILPGIAHLALAARAFPERSILEIRTLKLRRTVGAGEALDVFAEGPGEDGTARFEIRRGEETVSNGIVRLGPANRDPDPGIEIAAAGDFPDPAVLVPHAPPALFLRHVIEAGPEGIVCAVEIPSAHPLASEGRVPAFAGLEAAAQAAAILEALGRSGEEGGPRIGYLVGIRDARFQSAFLPADRPLRAEARLHGSVPPLSMYRVSVQGAGGEIVTGMISTYLRD
jgi:3-hydroxymyristoyl/3-hydroxydecanoyl-(acyl carrier protein) dehydratase